VPSQTEELLRALLALPVNDRADVAAELLASLTKPGESDRDAVEAAWGREIEHRTRRVVAGESAGEPWSDVRAHLTLNA
jgi:hypothetical protein